MGDQNSSDQGDSAEDNKDKNDLKESTIFKIMKFAAEREKKGQTFTGQELCDSLDLDWWTARKYATLTGKMDVIREGIFQRVHGDILSALAHETTIGWEAAETFQITYPAMMNYMEWVELQEARKSSKRAMSFAIASILIAASAFGTNVYFALQPTTVQLEENQLEQLRRLAITQSDER